MKIRNKFIIPVLALIIAMLMVGGSVSGTAVDTTPAAAEDTSTTHPLTYIPPTAPPTSSLDEEINAMVSNFISSNVTNPDQIGTDIRESSGILGKFITAITNFIDMIMAWISSIGDKLAGT